MGSSKLNDWWPVADKAEKQMWDDVCSDQTATGAFLVLQDGWREARPSPPALVAMPTFPYNKHYRRPSPQSSVNIAPPIPSGAPTSAVDCKLRSPNPLSRPRFKIANPKDLKEELLRQLQLQSNGGGSMNVVAKSKPSTQAASAVPSALPSPSLQPSPSAPTEIHPVPVPPPPPKSSVPVAVPIPAAPSSSDNSCRLLPVLNTSSSCNQYLNPATPSPPAQIPNRALLSRREIHIYSERARRKSMTHLYGTLHSLLPDAKQKADRCTVLTESIEYIQQLQEQVCELARKKAEIMEAMAKEEEEEGASDNEKEGSMESDWDDEYEEVVGWMMIKEDDADIAEEEEEEEEAEQMKWSSSGMKRKKKGKRRRRGRIISEEVRAAAMAAADVSLRICSPDAFITLNTPKKKGIWPRILQILDDHNLELLNVTFSATLDVVYHCIHARMLTPTTELPSHELQKALQDLVLAYFL